MITIRKTPMFPEAKEEENRLYGNDQFHSTWYNINDVPEKSSDVFANHESIMLTLAHADRLSLSLQEEEKEVLKSVCPIPKAIEVILSEGCATAVPVFETVDRHLLREMLEESLRFELTNRQKFKDGIYFETNTCRTHYMRGREFKKSNRDSRSTILRHEGKRRLRKLVCMKKGKL